MKRLVIVLARAGALACLAAHSFAAQDGPPSAKPAVEAPAASKLGAWPKPADKEALLVEIERGGFQVLHQRIALTPLRKLWIAARTHLRGR